MDCVADFAGIIIHNCITTTVLVAFPEVGMSKKVPDVAKVPESQVRYYAAQGDPAAQARLAVIGQSTEA